MKQIKQRLATAASNSFNPALLTFSKEWLFYKDSHQDLLIHLEILKRAAEKYLTLSLEDGRNQLQYPQLLRYFKLREIEKEIRLTSFKEKSSAEKDGLLEWVRSAGLRQPLKDFLNLLSEAGQPGEGREIPQNPRRVLESFFQEARPLGFDWQQYPNLNLHFSQMILTQEIQPEPLFEEIENVTALILQKLTFAPEEKKLLKLFRRYEILKKLFALELSRDEFLKLKKGDALLRPAALAGQLEEVTGMPSEKNPDSASMTALYEEAVKFYEIARNRETGMMESVENVLSQSGENKAVLVAGGFHSEGLHAKLRSSNISYISVLPKISNLNPDEDYIDQMMRRDRSAPRHSQVVQIGPDRVRISQMPVRDGAFISAQIARAKIEVTKGLGALAAGPAEMIHGGQFLPVGSRFEARSPRERNLLGKGLSLGKAQKIIGESMTLQNEGRPGLDYRTELTQEKLASLPSGERVDTIRNRASEEQALHNLVKNALDWNVSRDGKRTAPQNQSRFHGEGALGFLAELQEPDDYAIMESKTENGTGFRVTFWNRGTAESPLYQFYFEEAADVTSRGTRITVFKPLENWQERLRNINERLSVNTAAPIFINKNQINHPENYNVLDARHGKVNTRMNAVHIRVAPNGYLVADAGTGMTEKEFFENFLHSGIPEKEREELQKARTRKPEDTRIYASREISHETQTEGWINGHRTVVFSHAGPKRLNLVKQWILDFPPGTPHPNSGNNIAMDARALQGVRSVIDRLTDPQTEVENRFAQINSLAIYLRHIQPEAERARLGKQDLLRYLIQKMKGPQGLIEKLKATGQLNGRILVPNTLSAPNTLNGWAAFDHPKFIPLDEELFDFEFADLRGALTRLTSDERTVLVGQNAVLNTIPIYAAVWPFKDKVRGMPAVWILDENGNPALLVDAHVLRNERPNLAVIAHSLEFLAEKRLRELLRQKGIPLIEVSVKQRKEAKTGFFAWLASWKKWVIAAVAVGLFLIAPLIQFMRTGPAEPVLNEPAATLTQQSEPVKVKTLMVPEAAKPAPVSRPQEKKSEKPPIQVPPNWVPAKTDVQEMRPPGIPGANVRLPNTVDLELPAGERRGIVKKSTSPFKRQNRIGKSYRSGPIGSEATHGLLDGMLEQGKEDKEDPVYGFVENGVTVGGMQAPMMTGDIYPILDNSGNWVPQQEVLKTVKKGAVPVNTKPIRVSLWGDIEPGDFPLYNYFTGIVRDVRVVLINRKTNQADEKATAAFQSKWRRDREHLVFSAAAPEAYFARIEYEIDYYLPQDLEGFVSGSMISQREKDDFEKYFGPFLDSVKDKSDAEKFQAVTDFAHRIMIYDMYATPAQGALSVDRYESWSEAGADIITRGIDPALEPHQAVLKGLEAGNKICVVCNNVIPIVAAAFDYVGVRSAYIPVQHPDSSGVLTRGEMAHAKMAAEADGVFVEYDPTDALDSKESVAEASPAGNVGGIVTNSEEAKARRTKAIKDFQEHFGKLQKEGVITEAQASAAQSVLSTLQNEGRPLEESAKIFMQTLEQLTSDPQHTQTTLVLSRKLSKQIYAYDVFLAQMIFQDHVKRREEEKKRAENTAQSAKAVLRDAQIDGFLQENDYERASELLDLFINGVHTTAQQRNEFIQSWIAASKDPRVSDQAQEILEKLRFHFWEIRSASEMSYLYPLKMTLQSLRAKEVMNDNEFASLNTMIDQFWEDSSVLKDEDIHFLNDWMDFLSRDPEHGKAVQDAVKKLSGDHRFSHSRLTKELRALQGLLTDFQEKEKLQDPELERVLTLIKEKQVRRPTLEEESEIFQLLNNLKNRYPKSADLFYFGLETINHHNGSYLQGWNNVLEAKDAAYLTQRLVETLKEVASESDVRDFAGMIMQEYSKKEKGADELLKYLEKWKGVKEAETLKDKFNESKARAEYFKKVMENAEREKIARAFRDFWEPIALLGITFFLITGIIITMLWEGVRRDIKDQRKALRENNPYSGHNPDLEPELPGPLSSENHVEEGVVYLESENLRVLRDPLILDYSAQLDEAGRWSVSPAMRKKNRPQAAKSITGKFTILKRKVSAGQQVQMPHFPEGVIETVKVVAVDENGRKLPSSSQSAKRQGDRILFENEGWVEIHYEVSYYEPKDSYFIFPKTGLPRNEKLDIEKYFGKGKNGLDQFLNASWRDKVSVVTHFVKDRVIIDLSATGEKAFRREAHHTSWAHALHEHLQKNGKVRVNFSTAVLIKFLLLNYFGLPVIRIKRASVAESKVSRHGGGPFRLDTSMAGMDSFLVGVPVLPEQNKSAEQAADELIAKGSIYVMTPLGKGLASDGQSVKRVWYMDQTIDDWKTRDSYWNNDEPRWYLILGKIFTLRLFPFAATTFTSLSRFIFWLAKNILWPYPWLRETVKRTGLYFREIKTSFTDRKHMNEVLNYFEVPLKSPVRTIAGRIQKHVSASNRGWVLLGSAKRARFSMMAAVLKSRPDQLELLKKLHAYQRAQGPDSELGFFAGLFRMIDASTNEILSYSVNSNPLSPSVSTYLTKTVSPETNDYLMKSVLKKEKYSRESLIRRGGEGRTEASGPFSPVYLYTGHNMTLPAEAIQVGEALLDYAHSRGHLETVIPVLDFARTLMGLHADKTRHPLSPDPGVMITRMFRRALNELQKHGNVATTVEIKEFLNQNLSERVSRLSSLWRFNDEAQPDLDIYFPYPQREIVEYLIGREGLVEEVDAHPAKKLGPGTSFFDDSSVNASLGNKLRSLAWLVDAAGVIEKKEAAFMQAGQAMPPLDFEAVQEAAAEAAREKNEPQNRPSMVDTIKSQSQPGMVRIRETIQNARDITREVPEAKRETELARFGGKREVRVRSFLNREHPDRRLRKITSVEDSVGMTLDVLIMKFFPRWATTKSPSAIIMRTLKEPLSAEEKTETIFQKLVLPSERGNPQLRARILEAVQRIPEAGPREDDAAEILALLGRALDPDKKSAGLFGIGNYTIYDDADEVVIRTGINGKVMYLRLKVIRENIEGQNVITDIEMEEFKMYEDPQGLYKGTEVQHIKLVPENQRQEADLEDRYMKYLFSKYVGSVSDVDIAFYRQTAEDPEPRRLEISIKDPREMLAQHGDVSVLSSKMKIGRLTVDELYIQDPVHNPSEPGFFKYIPAWGMDWIQKKGINFQPRKSTPVTESRGAVRFPDRDNRNAAAAAMKAMVGGYRQGALTPEGFPPYAEFLKNPKFFFSEAVRDLEIIDDAETLNRGENISHERWASYFEDDVLDEEGRGYTAADKYRALFSLIKTPRGETVQSLMEEKEQRFFGKVPEWIKIQYFENPEFQSLVTEQSLSSLNVFSSNFPEQAALILFSATVVLYAQRKLVFPNAQEGFPGMPYTFEDYIVPGSVTQEPGPEVLRDLERIRNGEISEIDFESMKNDPQRLARFLMELPGKNGKSIHQVRQEVLDLSQQGGGADTRRAAGAVSSKYVLGTEDSPLIAALEAFLKEIKKNLEEKLDASELGRFYFYKPFSLSEDSEDWGLLADFDAFLSGRDPEGRNLIARVQKHFSSEETVDAGFLFFSSLMELDIRQLRRSLAERGAGGSLETLRAFMNQKKREGLAVEYALPRAENRREEKPPVSVESLSVVEISGEAKLEVARAAAAKLIGLETRSEVKEQYMQSLWPDLREEALNGSVSRLQEAIYNSAEKIAVLSVVPGDLDGTDLDRYAEGILAGLSQKELTHEVIVMVQGDPGAFQTRFEKKFTPLTRGMERARVSALNSKIHFISAGSDFLQTVLLSGISKVMLAAPSDFKGSGLTEVQAQRVFVDRLASGETFSSSKDFRKALGTFVTASFEAALLPVSEISEKDRVLLQTRDQQWYASSLSALETLGRSLGQMIRNAQKVLQSA